MNNCELQYRLKCIVMLPWLYPCTLYKCSNGHMTLSESRCNAFCVSGTTEIISPVGLYSNNVNALIELTRSVNKQRPIDCIDCGVGEQERRVAYEGSRQRMLCRDGSHLRACRYGNPVANRCEYGKVSLPPYEPCVHTLPTWCIYHLIHHRHMHLRKCMLECSDTHIWNSHSTGGTEDMSTNA